MLSIGQALAAMLPSFAPLEAEDLPLMAAHGRALAQDCVATAALPRFDLSAMDGYAVRHAELAVDHELCVLGESRAEAGEPPELAPGTAMRIFTGGKLPLGADSVVMQEDTQRTGDRVRLRALPALGAHVRRRGSDLRPGAIAVATGSVIGAGEIGLLASLDRARVTVYRKPRVAILPSGDELRELGSPDAPGLIVNSNALSLAAAVADAGCEPEILPIARDRLDELEAGVRHGTQADVLLTIGGVSVGDYDLMERALRNAGFELTFHKVAIKPGKPLLFGAATVPAAEPLNGGLRRVPVIGLPGNPVSAFVTFEVFVRPCLLRMRGVAHAFPELVPIELSAPVRHSRGRLEFARARVRTLEGRLLADLHPQQGSGSQPSLADVQALVLLPAEQAELPAGARTTALLLGAPRRASSPFDADVP
jgi:molybdopterin molybdotransferase